MEKFISNESKNGLLKIGLYQVVGGAIGILILAWSTIKNRNLTEMNIFLLLVIILFFSYSIFCGSLCLKMKESCFMHSYINQGMQLIGFMMMGYAFKFAAGFYLTIEFFLRESIGFSLGTGLSKLTLNINTAPAANEIEINLIALAIIIWLDKLHRKIKEEMTIRSDTSFL